MKKLLKLLILVSIFFLQACSPHPSAGIWKANEGNLYGITKINMDLEGRADFVTPDFNNETWHCFWSAKEEMLAELKCSPSTDPKQSDLFFIHIIDSDRAQLEHNSKTVAILTRQDGNPSTSK